MSRINRKAASAVAALGLATAAGAGMTHTTTFDGGDLEGWSGPQGPGGSTFVDDTSGNPAPSYHTVFNNFGITFQNDSNPAFVDDLTAYDEVTISMDVKVNDISFIGTPVSRPWVLELRDFDNGDSPYPWDSVWFKFDDLTSAEHGDWTTLSVTISDPNASALPAGWGGTGDETAGAKPILPADRSFADILSTYDEMAITSLEPGFAFGFTDFDVEIDNISITKVPAPGSAAVFGLGLAAATRRRRR